MNYRVIIANEKIQIETKIVTKGIKNATFSLRVVKVFRDNYDNKD